MLINLEAFQPWAVDQEHLSHLGSFLWSISWLQEPKYLILWAMRQPRNLVSSFLFLCFSSSSKRFDKDPDLEATALTSASQSCSHQVKTPSVFHHPRGARAGDLGTSMVPPAQTCYKSLNSTKASLSSFSLFLFLQLRTLYFQPPFILLVNFLPDQVSRKC